MARWQDGRCVDRARHSPSPGPLASAWNEAAALESSCTFSGLAFVVSPAGCSGRGTLKVERGLLVFNERRGVTGMYLHRRSEASSGPQWRTGRPFGKHSNVIYGLPC